MPPRALERVAFALLWAVVCAWAVAYVCAPFGWDQGIFAWLGAAVARGDIPYRDAWDQKGPLTFLPYALSAWLTGSSMWGVRVFDLALLGAACFSGGRLVARVSSRRAGQYAAGFLALGYAQFRAWNTAQPDGWAALLMVIAVDFLTRDEGVLEPRASYSRAALASAIVGLCTLFKPNLALFLVLPTMHSWTRRSTLSIRKSALTSLGAFLLPTALTLAWFAYHHALASLYDGYIRWNAESMKDALSWGAAIEKSRYYVATTPSVALALPLFAYAVAALFATKPRTATLVATWGLLSFLCIFMQRRFYQYHWHLVGPPLVLGAAIALAQMWRAGSGQRAFALVAIALSFCLIAFHPIHDAHRWLRYAMGDTTFEGFCDAIDQDGGELYRHDGFAAGRDVRVAAYLRTHTTPDETVFTWSDPLVNYLAERRSPARVPTGRPYNDWASAGRRKAFTDELLTRLHDTPPRYIVMLDRAMSGDADDPINVAVRFPALQRVVADGYLLETTMDDFRIYVRGHQ